RGRVAREAVAGRAGDGQAAHGHVVAGLDSESAWSGIVDGFRPGGNVAVDANQSWAAERTWRTGWEGDRGRGESRRAGSSREGGHRDGEGLRVVDLVDRCLRRDADRGIDGVLRFCAQ